MKWKDKIKDNSLIIIVLAIIIFLSLVMALWFSLTTNKISLGNDNNANLNQIQQKLDKEFDNQKTKFALEFDTYQKQWRDLLDDIKEFSLSTDNSKEPEVKIENENPEKK